MKVNTNIAASIAQSAVNSSRRELDTAMERLATGQRINSAADDASGLAISNRMTTQILGSAVASKNANDAINLLNTVDGGLHSMELALQRMRELGVQSLNGTNSTTDRQYLNAEFRALFLELKDIAYNTKFNDRRVLDEETTLSFQISHKPAVTVDIELENFSFDRFASYYRGSMDTSSGAVAVGDTIEILGSAPFGSNYNTMWDAYSSDYPDQSLTGRQNAHVHNGTITINDAEIVALMNSGDTSRANMDKISSYLTGELQKIDGFESAGVWWSNSGAFFYHNPFENGYRVDIGEINSAASLGGGVVDPFYADSFFHIVYDHVTKNAIEIVDARLNEVTAYRAKVGSTVNALTSVVDNLMSSKINAESARSRVIDTDYAKVTSEMVRARVIQEAGMAMVSQANITPRTVLNLLGN